MINKKVWSLLSALVIAGLLIVAFGCAAPAVTPTTPAPTAPLPTPTTPAPTTPKPTTPVPTPTLTPTQTATKVFKFANITALSGAAASYGIPQIRAFQYAINDLGGQIVVGGEPYKIELVNYDDEYKTDKAVDATKRAIFLDGIKYVLVMGGACVKASQPWTERNGVLMIAHTLASKEVCNPSNPLTFFTMINCSAYGPTIYYPEIIKEFGVKKLAIVDPDDETGYMSVGVIKDVLKNTQMPLEIVSEQYFTRGTQDFTPIILRVLAAKPDLIDISVPSDGDCGLFLKQLGEAGYTGLHMTSAAGVTPGALYKIAGKYAVGHFLFGGATPPTPAYAALGDRYKKDFGEDMPGPVPYLYEEFYYLLKAIAQAGTFDTMKVAYTFENMEWDGVYGHFRWGGTEPAFGFGVKRTPLAPFAMGRIGPDGKAQDWKLLSLK